MTLLMCAAAQVGEAVTACGWVCTWLGLQVGLLAGHPPSTPSGMSKPPFQMTLPLQQGRTGKWEGGRQAGCIL